MPLLRKREKDKLEKVFKKAHKLFIEGYSYEDIGKKCGKSASWVNKYKKLIIK